MKVNQMQLDLSKLTRRKPDMKNVTAPRFKFPGWRLVTSSGMVIPEEEFANNKPQDIAIELPRNPSHATLTLKFDGDCCWCIEARCLQRHWQHVFCNVGGDFETVVKAAENFILQAVSRQDYRVIRPRDPEIRNFNAFVADLDELMGIWRSDKI